MIIQGVVPATPSHSLQSSLRIFENQHWTAIGGTPPIVRSNLSHSHLPPSYKTFLIFMLAKCQTRAIKDVHKYASKQQKKRRLHFAIRTLRGVKSTKLW